MPDDSEIILSFRDKQPPLILSPAAPVVSAEEYVRRECMHPDGKILRHRSGEFLCWTGTHYVPVEAEKVRAFLYAFLRSANCTASDGSLVPFNPTRSKVANVMEALAAEVQLDRQVRPPAWLDFQSRPDPAEMLACNNGLLHLPTRQLLPHTPSFFGRSVLPFNFAPDAPEPREWLNFLSQLWPGDTPSIEALQEMFGLLLTPDMRYQKAFLIVGPKRSGKGTIARVLKDLLGPASVCDSTLNGLGKQFGLAPLIGKRLAIIPDARLGTKVDEHVILERLLAITGEDALDIDRKYRDHWVGKLETRFLILSNELPQLTDASGAMASRFITLVLRNSFFGKEDHRLGEKLARELPGILLWSLAGLDRLRARGHFVPPSSSEALQQDMEDLGSPLRAFLRDHCEISPNGTVRVDQLYKSWCKWCQREGHDRPGSSQVLGKKLRALIPGLMKTQPRDPETGKQNWWYKGISLMG
jgi:putative DNA primase/helicase